MRVERKNKSEETKKPYPWIGLFGQTAAILCCSGFHGNDADRAALVRTLDGEFNHTVFQREQGVILADTDIGTRMELGSTLTNQDIAGWNQLTTVALDAQAF